MKELVIFRLFKLGLQLLLEIKMAKYYYKRELTEISGGLPGGCQDLGEDLRFTAAREAFEETGIKLNTDKLKLIDTLSGSSRKNSYPNGDIVYNNTSLYLADVSIADESSLKGDSETKRLKFLI